MTTPFANSVTSLAEMVVLNYLGLHGEQAMFGAVLDNPHNPIYGIARAGANGEFAVTVGSDNTESGGNSRAPDSMIQPETTLIGFRTSKLFLVLRHCLILV